MSRAALNYYSTFSALMGNLNLLNNLKTAVADPDWVIYEGYIHSRAWEKIKGLNVSDPQAMEEELFAVGWIGFVSALKNHDTSKGSFTTYV